MCLDGSLRVESIKGHFERVLLLGNPSFCSLISAVSGVLGREFQIGLFVVVVVCNLSVHILHGRYHK